MATRAIPVTEDQKNEPGVMEAVTTVGDLVLKSYVKVEKVDDLDAKVTEGVETVQFAIPIEETEEVEAKDNTGATIIGKDEQPVMHTVTFWATRRLEIDLGKVNRDKLATALKRFADVGREAPVPVPTQPRLPGRSSASAARGEWLDRARTWLRSAGHEVADRGRLSEKLKEIYAKNNPNDPEPN
jgi:hypothetical protein